MKKTATCQLYGLIGHPVKHSYSAVMHNAAFAYYKRNARYQLFEVSPQELEVFFKETIFEKKINGLNVTVPHKEKAVVYLNGHISLGVRINQAVNTVRVEKDRTLSGFNTDGAGFLRDLKSKKVQVTGKKISLIGAGGGAKAVATSLASKKPKQLLIFDINRAKSTALVDILKEFYPDVGAQAVESLEGLNIQGADLLIHATPVGMKKTDPLLVEKAWLSKDLFVYDLIYNPLETKLLKTAREAGCRYSNGLGMLLYQGCLAFQIWTQKRAPLEVMRQALKEKIGGAINV